jgi:hypothetical protein
VIENRGRGKYEKVKSVKGKELLARFMEECENKRVGNFRDAEPWQAVRCKFTGHSITELTILKVKHIERGKAAANGEKSELNGKGAQELPLAVPIASRQR